MKGMHQRSTVVAVGVTALLLSGAGVAASSGGGAAPWLLGSANQARDTTKLTSRPSVDQATVELKNRGSGPALSLKTKRNQAPLTVRSEVKVDRLNADRLDGLDASAFEQVPPVPLTVVVLNADAQPVPDATSTPLGTYFEVYDPSDMHWAASPSSLMAPRSGTYLVSATVTWTANGVGWRSAELRSAGSVVARVTGPPAGAATPTVQTLSGIARLTQGEGVTLAVMQTSGGGALGASMTTFQMTYVGS